MAMAEGHADRTGGQPQLAEWMARLEQKMDAVVEMHRQLRHCTWQPPEVVREAAEGGQSQCSGAPRERSGRGLMMGAPLCSEEQQAPLTRLASVVEEQEEEQQQQHSGPTALDGAKATSVTEEDDVADVTRLRRRDSRRGTGDSNVMKMVSEKSTKSAMSRGGSMSWGMKSVRSWQPMWSHGMAGRKTARHSQTSEKSLRTARNELFMKRKSKQLENQISRTRTNIDVVSTASLTNTSTLKRIIRSTRFDMLITIVIIANSFLIGAQVQHKAVSHSEVELGWSTYAEYVCTLLFAVELFVRMAVLRQEFFTNVDERWWNAFDTFLVIISFFDFFLNELTGTALPGSGSFISRLGRAIRIARIMRIVRAVRFLSPLRIMLSMIAGSLKPLFWILVMLVGVIYSFSIVLTEGTSDYLMHSGVAPADHNEVDVLFGSLFDTMYTLFQCISGGLQWGEVSVLMRGPGWLLEAIFVVYMFFVIVAVTNIVNGIFVDGAIELAKRDRTLMIDKQKKDDQSKQTHLVHLLGEMDKDEDGMINFWEFCESLEREHVQDYMSALKLEISDAKAFFTLLDSDGTGSVNIVDFVGGMMKLRGEARSVDVHMVLRQNAKLTKFVYELTELFRDGARQEKIGGAGSRHPPAAAVDHRAPPEPACYDI